MKITLHCNVPYSPETPNAAIGYLKGFLKGKGIDVRNIYWNLILFDEMHFFTSRLGKPTDINLYFTEYIMYVLSRLLKSDNRERTFLDPYLENIFPEHIVSKRLKAMVETVESYVDHEKLYDCDVAGFTVKTYQWFMDYIVIKMIKKANPNLRVLMGGFRTSAQASEFMKVMDEADYGIWGEGEYPMLDFLRFLEGEKKEDEVPNLVYRNGSRLQSTYEMDREGLPNVDSYPFADHSDYFRTLREMKLESLSPDIPIWGSRSCSWNKCKFCVLTESYPFRERSPGNIIEEMEYQSEEHSTYRFLFVDTNVAGSSKKRLRTLLKLIFESSSKRRKPYQLFGEMSPLHMDREVAKLAELAGFDSVQVGYEAMTDRLLSKMQKMHAFAHNIQVLKCGQEFDLDLEGLLVMKGIPAEEERDVIESMHNLRFIRFFPSRHDITPNSFTLYGGAPFYEEMSEDDREKWNINPIYYEIKGTNLLTDVDRFEFFGFKSDFAHSFAWEQFERLLSKFSETEFAYKWIDYGDFSVIEEYGFNSIRYTFDKDKTDLLIFCDDIKNFSQARRRFSHINEVKLLSIMKALKEAAFLYYDENLHHIISCVSAKRIVRMKD